ncbi:MAG: hypothetical protein JO013_07130 [Alphaproteobacteria bacterium]|nr:hypothetical protein [Alphaproteobacteria bacterium]
MKKSLVILALVAGCGASDRGADHQARSGAGQGKAAGAAASAMPAPVDPGGLAGLWEGGAAARPNQLCIVPKGDSVQFGVTIWGAGQASCSGAGLARRDGDRLTLTMTGDSACVIDARVDGGRIVLPADLPQGCAYYCAAQARFAGAAFSRKAAGAAAAAGASDLAGDPLCG